MAKITGPNDNRQVMTDILVNEGQKGDLIKVPTVVSSTRVLSQKASQTYLGKVFDKSQNKYIEASKDLKLYEFFQTAFNPNIPTFIKRNERTVRGNYSGGEAAHAAAGARQWAFGSSAAKFASVGLAFGSLAVPPLIIPSSITGILGIIFSVISVARGEKGEADARMLSHFTAAVPEFKRITNLYNSMLNLNLTEEQIDAFASKQASRFAYATAAGVDYGRLKLSVGGSVAMSALLILPSLQSVIEPFQGSTGLFTIAGAHQGAQLGRRMLAIQAVYSHIASGQTFTEAIEQTKVELTGNDYQFQPGVVSHEESLEVSAIIDKVYTAFTQDLTELTNNTTIISPEKVANLLQENQAHVNNFTKASLLNHKSTSETLLQILDQHANKTGAADTFYQQQFNALNNAENIIKDQLSILEEAKNTTHRANTKSLISNKIEALKENQRELFVEAIHFLKDTGYIDDTFEIDLSKPKTQGWMTALLETVEEYKAKNLSSTAKIQLFDSKFNTRIKRLIKAINEDRPVHSAQQLKSRKYMGIARLVNLKFAGATRFLNQKREDNNLELAWDQNLSNELINTLQKKITLLHIEAKKEKNSEQGMTASWTPSELKLLEEAKLYYEPSQKQNYLRYDHNGLSLVSMSKAERAIKKLERELKTIKDQQRWLVKSENAKLSKKVVYQLLTQKENHNLRPFIYNSPEKYNASKDTSITKPASDLNRVHWSGLSNKLINEIENKIAQLPEETITGKQIASLLDNQELNQLAYKTLMGFSKSSATRFDKATEDEKKQFIRAYLHGLIVESIDCAIRFMSAEVEPYKPKKDRKFTKSISDKSLSAQQRQQYAKIAKVFFDIRHHVDKKALRALDTPVSKTYQTRIESLREMLVDNQGTIDEGHEYLPPEPIKLEKKDERPESEKAEAQAQAAVVPTRTAPVSKEIVMDLLYQFAQLKKNKIDQAKLMTIAHSVTSASFVEMARKTFATTSFEELWNASMADAKNALNNMGTGEQLSNFFAQHEEKHLTAHKLYRKTNTIDQSLGQEFAQTVPYILLSMLATIDKEETVDNNRQAFASERAYVLFNEWLDKLDQGQTTELNFAESKYFGDIQESLKSEIKTIGERIGISLPDADAVHPPVGGRFDKLTLIKMLKSARLAAKNPSLARFIPTQHITTLFNYQKKLLPTFPKPAASAIKPDYTIQKITINWAVKIGQPFTDFASQLAHAALKDHALSLEIKNFDSDNIAKTTFNNLEKFIPEIKLQPAWLTPEQTIEKHKNQPQQALRRQAQVWNKLMAQIKAGDKPFKPSQLKQLAEASVILAYTAQVQLDQQREAKQNPEKIAKAITQFVDRSEIDFSEVADLIDDINEVDDAVSKTLSNESQAEFLARMQSPTPSSEQVKWLMQAFKNDPGALKRFEELDSFNKLDQLEAATHLFKEELRLNSIQARREKALRLFDIRNNAIQQGRADLSLRYPHNDFEVRVKEALIQRYERNGQYRLANKLIKNESRILPSILVNTKKRTEMVKTINRKTKVIEPHNSAFKARANDKSNKGGSQTLNFGFYKQLVTKSNKNIQRSTASSINTLIQDSLVEHEKRFEKSNMSWINDLMPQPVKSVPSANQRLIDLGIIGSAAQNDNLQMSDLSDDENSVSSTESTPQMAAFQITNEIDVDSFIKPKAQQQPDAEGYSEQIAQALSCPTTESLLSNHAQLIETMIKRAIANPQDNVSINFLMSIADEIAGDYNFQSHKSQSGQTLYNLIKQIKNTAIFDENNSAGPKGKYNNIDV